MAAVRIVRGSRAWRTRRSGQILVILLLAVFLLAGLTFYVYNAGEQVNKRVEMQNVADAVAISGADYMARCMNVVAMNNVAQSRYLAYVPVLDAISQATDLAFGELDEWIGDNRYAVAGDPRPIRGLTALVTGLQGGAGAALIDDYSRGLIVEGLNGLLGRMTEQREVMAPIRGLRGTIENATTWYIRGAGGVPPHGTLWRAAVALDEFSLATVESAGLLAQADAVRYGEDNKADVAFVVPVMPELPAHRGTIQDFAPALRHRLRVDLVAKTMSHEHSSDQGGAIPDPAWPYRLGPWARLFERPGWYPHWDHYGRLGWREDWGIRVPTGPTRSRQVTVNIAPRTGKQITGPSAGGGRAGHAASRGQGYRQGASYTRTRSWTPTKFMARGYTTYGPYKWMRAWVRDYIGDKLPDARLREYYDKIVDTKLGYMFAGVNPPLKVMHQPQWWTDYAQAEKIGENPDYRKAFTKYYYIEVIWRIDGNNRVITSHNLDSPVARDFTGWVPHEDLYQKVFNRNPEVTYVGQIGALPIWKFTAEGHETLYAPDGAVTGEYTVEFEWYFIFGGLDAGGDLAIQNPCNWDDLESVPAPMLLNVDAWAGYDPNPNVGMRLDKFAMLGVVREETHAPFWKRRFANANPLSSIVAVAQAKIFNNTSWDLWTQDWQAQLNVVTDWEYWVDRVDVGIDEAAYTNGLVPPHEVQTARDYMWNLGADMAADYLTH